MSNLIYFPQEMAYELQVSCHVMHIVAMEAYCVMQ